MEILITTFYPTPFPYLAFQCSARGGKLKINLRNDGRVDIGGQSVIVSEGFLAI